MCIQVCIYTSMYVCLCEYVQMCVYVIMHMHACIHMCLCVYLCMQFYMCMQVYMCVYLNVYRQVNVYMQMFMYEYCAHVCLLCMHMCGVYMYVHVCNTDACTCLNVCVMYILYHFLVRIDHELENLWIRKLKIYKFALLTLDKYFTMFKIERVMGQL